MTVVNVTLPSDDTRANVADYNDPITRILAVLNGGLDDDNITGMNGSKLTDNTVTPAKLTAAVKTGWWDTTAPSSVTALGNRSYSLVVNSTDLTGIISTGMRIRTVNTANGPTQCTSLNGTTQYYSKSSPNKLTFTDDFVVSAWIKVSSYAQGVIASRYNGTSGWVVLMESDGRLTIRGYNAGAANSRGGSTYQSVPLNKWVHICLQNDMSTYTATTTTTYAMIDGVGVPLALAQGGTNPTALIQAGNLEIGSWNGGLLPFSGKIAQLAIYSAKVTQANILATISQGLTGAETSLASAYSFNNSITDLNTTTPNDLTAVASAAATNADSFTGQDDEGVPSATVNFGVVQKVSFSTNTTIIVQVPEGCTIPTTGGITSMQYSTQKTPFGFPTDAARWRILFLSKSARTQSSPTQSTWYNMTTTSGASGGTYLTIPIGAWFASYFVNYSNVGTTNTITQHTLSTGSSTETDTDFTTREGAAGAVTTLGSITRSKHINVAAQAPYYLNTRTDQTGMSTMGDNANSLIYADLANL